MEKRTDKINYYLDIAETVLERGTCLRRNFGAIIVNNDEIILTGSPTLIHSPETPQFISRHFLHKQI